VFFKKGGWLVDWLGLMRYFSACMSGKNFPRIPWNERTKVGVDTCRDRALNASGRGYYSQAKAGRAAKATHGTQVPSWQVVPYGCLFLQILPVKEGFLCTSRNRGYQCRGSGRRGREGARVHIGPHWAETAGRAPPGGWVGVWFSSRLYYPFGKGLGQHIIRCL